MQDDDDVPMTRKEKLAMWRARRLAAKAAEEEAANAERQVSGLPIVWCIKQCGGIAERALGKLCHAAFQSACKVHPCNAIFVSSTCR